MKLVVECYDTYSCEVPEDIAEQYRNDELTKEDLLEILDDLIWDSLEEYKITDIDIQE